MLSFYNIRCTSTILGGAKVTEKLCEIALSAVPGIASHAPQAPTQSILLVQGAEQQSHTAAEHTKEEIWEKSKRRTRVSIASRTHTRSLMLR